ncbi:MAG: restriction endonuclease subunit S [Spirochaetales bacterium]|jgi:restriction endonuclease S subunit|nr:restriction endonuclease subunit S [Spirochaetales bacterium]
MKISDLFTLHQGNSFELINMEIDKYSEFNFIARTSENNGVTARVKAINTIPPFPAGYITVALGGSVLSSFVQRKPFYTGFHVMALEPKKEMRLEEKLFYCHCIKMNAYRYRYGRQANKTLKHIELPELPDWLKTYTIDYSRITTRIKKKELPLEISKWKKFKIGNIFNFKRGKGITKEEIENNAGLIPCVQSGEINRGIIGYMSSTFINDKFHAYIPAPFLSLARSGTSGCVNIQNKDSYAGDSVYTLKLKDNENMYIYLFLETILNLERYRYTYGRKAVIEKYIEQFISLPATSAGEPDWVFMENYIKALPYSDKI